MASIINASSTGSGGIVQTADASGVLQLQSNGVTALSTSGANVTIAGTLTTAAQSIAKASLPTGSVLQVVQGVDTTGRSTNANWPVASGFGASITPTSASSKILVLMNIQTWLNSGANTNKIGIYGIYRSSTYLYGQRLSVNANYASLDIFYNATLNYLDSPNTTSSVTYNLYWGRYDSTSFPNTLNMGDGLPAVGGTQPSSIILLEIAA